MRLFFLILILPAIGFCSFEKEAILKEFSANLIKLDIDGAFQSIEHWKELYPDDIYTAEVCKAFILLLDGQPDEAKFLFEVNFPDMLVQDELFIARNQISNLFYQALNSYGNYLTLETSNSNAKIVLCKNRSRFWKGKAFLGVVLMGVGAVVAVVNPPIGLGLIVSSLPMALEGIEDSEDYHEEIDRRKNERKRFEGELDQTSYFSEDENNIL